MKTIVRNLTLLSCVGSSAFAAPFLAIGDNAELFVTADVSASYNDNILLSPSASRLEDEVFAFTPGFDLQFGKDSLIKGSLIGTARFTGYSDNTNLNNQLLGINGLSSYDNGQLKLNANAGFNELDQPTIDTLPLPGSPATGRLVERHVTTAGINGELAFSEKISVGTGFSYNYTDYKEVGYIDQKDYTVPVNVYYELTPKVDVSAGVRYTRSNLSNDFHYDAYYYNVGARGSFTPKLSGNFSVGYNTRKVNIGSDDDGSIGADAALSYAYSEKTQFTLSLARNYENAAAGGVSYENTQVTVGANTALTVDWSVNAALTYRRLDYQTGGRTDDYFEGQVGATYLINEHLSSALSYLYRTNSSDVTGAGFRNNLVTLSLSARY